ncbi:MAG: hypothetical protein ABI870_14940 [Rhodanobacter sp.]
MWIKGNSRFFASISAPLFPVRQSPLLRIAGILFVLVLLLISRPASASVEFECKEGSNSFLVCDFIVVRVVDTGDALNPEFHRVEDVIVQGGKTTSLGDEYLGKVYCPTWISAFKGILPDEPKNPPSGIVECLGRFTVERHNEFGTLRTSLESFMPIGFPEREVERCVLISERYANRPYDYKKDGLAFWYVVATKPHTIFPGPYLLTNVESELVQSVCHQKWSIEKSTEGSSWDAANYTSIQDFIPPTALGWEQAKSQLHDEIKQYIAQSKVIKDGYVLQLKIEAHWYGFYEELYYEAKVTRTNDANSAPVVADNLILYWQHGSNWGAKNCGKTSFCAQSERLYATSAFAPPKLCGAATSVLTGLTITVRYPEREQCTHS